MADQSPPLTVPDPLPLGLTDSEAFIRQPTFNKTTTFRPAFAPTQDHVVSYAVSGSPDASAPWVVWLNGMGSHRLAAAFFDGPAAAHGLRFLAFDRPGAGRSTAVPLASRVEASYDALLAVLRAEGIAEFGLYTHSNGFVYALHALPRLAAAGIRITAWGLSAAWVPPWLSGSALLSAARVLPAALTGKLGAVVGAVESALGPIGGAFGWSSGVARQVVSFSGRVVGGAGAGAEAEAGGAPGAQARRAAGRGRVSPGQQYLLDARKDRDRPPHKQTYGRRFYSPATVDAGMAVVLAEGLGAVGAEALLALAKADGAHWGWGADAHGAVDPAVQYEVGLTALRAAWGERPGMAPRRVRAWYGEGDLIVPRRGQAYLRGLMVDRFRLVEAEDWVVIREAGHDDVVGLTMFAEPLLEMFAAAAAAGGGVAGRA